MRGDYPLHNLLSEIIKIVTPPLHRLFGVIAVISWAMSGITTSIAMKFGVDYIALSIVEIIFITTGMIAIRRKTVYSALKNILNSSAQKKFFTILMALMFVGHQLCFIAAFWAGLDALSLSFNYLWPVFLFMFTKSRKLWTWKELSQIFLACSGGGLAIISASTTQSSIILGSFIGILSALLAALYMTISMRVFYTGPVSSLDALPLSTLFILPICIAVLYPYTVEFSYLSLIFGLLIGIVFGAMPELLWLKYISIIKSSHKLFLGAAIPVISVPSVALISSEPIGWMQIFSIFCLISASVLSFGSTSDER